VYCVTQYNNSYTAFGLKLLIFARILIIDIVKI